jgi:antitoxin (DNA-binding transcriptional repressor) of toxin-antitoxin stability system
MHMKKPVMRTTTITRLRREIGRYVDAAEQGATGIIYRHGKPVAELRSTDADPVPAWKHPANRPHPLLEPSCPSCCREEVRPLTPLPLLC